MTFAGQTVRHVCILQESCSRKCHFWPCDSYMGGVDRADQLCGYYRVRMKSHKFYRFVLLNLLVFRSLYFILFFSLHNRYIFWFLMDCCTVNAFTLLKYFQPSTGSTIRQQVFKAFRLELAQGLIGNYNSRQRYALPPAPALRSLFPILKTCQY